MLLPIFSADSLIVRNGPDVVLDRASLTIHAGERLGMVGRNGSGKSTFLQIVVGVLEPDSGTVSRRRDLSTGYLPQVTEPAADQTVRGCIMEGAARIQDLIAQYRRSPPDSNESTKLLDRIDHLDGWNLDHRVEALAGNLGVSDLDRPITTLSGGEKRRVALCRALISQPDFLILDEPTNHLDADSVQWIEEFLGRYAGTVLLVTHDRYFLDRVTTSIVELSRGRFLRYEGNYTDFLIARAERQSAEELLEHKRQLFLKKELEWVRRSPSARRTKSIDRVERYFELAAQSAPALETEMELIIPPAGKLGGRVIELIDISYAIDGRSLFQHLTIDLQAGDRIGIIGRNGLGKSTLLKVILGQLPPATGAVAIGPRVVINYVDQNRTSLDPEKTVWETVGGGSEIVHLGETRLSLRAYLRRFLFTEERINSKVGALSGGEQNRVVLAQALKRGGNALVLDEPTNDLDLGSLRLLEEALANFDGTILVVSHDRYFLNRVCTRILAFEGDGVTRLTPGNYDYYLQKQDEEQQARKAGVSPASAAAKSPAADQANAPRRLKWKEARELEQMEAKILEAEQEVHRLETVFAAPDFYQTHGANWKSLESELNTAREKVIALYQRWEELESFRLNGETGPR